MASLQDTVDAVLLALKERGKNLQETDVADSELDFELLLGFKSNGDFIRISPSVLRSANTKYLTESQYNDLLSKGEISDDVEYNIYEDE